MSVLGGLLLSGAGGLLAVAGVRRLLTAVSLSRNEATPLRDVAAAEGPVEFAGEAKPGDEARAFEAPFSGTETLCCTVWMETGDRHRTDVEGLELPGPQDPETYRNTDQAWLLAETDEIRRQFVVEDGGTRVAVDPAGADLDVTDHVGETALTVAAGDSLPDDVRDRLEALHEAETGFDGTPEKWDREDDRVNYREARLEPGTPVHVAGGAVEAVPEEWGSSTAATVGNPGGDTRYLISRGTESGVVRRHLVQFATGVSVGLVLLLLGVHTLDLVTLV